MKKRVCFLLCIVMLGAMMALPVSAAIFQVSYYNEAIYAGDSATCTAQAECKVCGNAYGELSDHRWSPTFLYQDSTGHAWICADCKNHSEVEPHTPGPAATDTEPQTCKDCGNIITPVKNHTHKLSKVAQTPANCMQAGNIEYYTCDGCSACFTDAAGKEKLPDTKAMEVGVLGHMASETFGCDTEYHWRSCTVCGEVLAETKMLHEKESGVCTTYGYQEGVIPTAKLSMKPTQTPREGEHTPYAAAAAPEATTVSQTTVFQPEDTPKAKQQVPVNALAVVLLGVVSFSIAITTTVIIMKKKK